MDYCFMRTDTGYDVMMLAIKNKEGDYQVYRLSDGSTQSPYLFKEKHPEKLRERVQAWCRDHLPDDMEMTGLVVPKGEEAYYRIKNFLREKHIPYEMKKRTFYISKRAFEAHKNELLLLSGNKRKAYG